MKKHYLEHTDWPVVSIINYRGCLVEKIIGSYKIFDKVAATPDDVDKIIDEALKALDKSIKTKP